MTIREISEHLGIGRSTISAVLNDKTENRYIAKDTKKKILDYVKKVGYHQSIATLSMQKKYSKDIVIVIRAHMTQQQQQVYLRLVQNLEKLQLSYGTIFFNDTKGLPLLAKEIEFLNSRKIIVFPIFGYHYTPCKEWNELRKNSFNDIPCFFFDMEPEVLLCNVKDSFAQMNRMAAYEEIARIMSYGRFTHVVMPPHPSIVRHLKQTNSKLIMLNGISAVKMLEPEKVFYSAGLLDVGKEYAKEILKQSFPKGRTAAFLGNDYVSCGAIKYLRENSIKIPEDIEFFSFAYMRENGLFKYPFTSWQFPYEEMYQRMIKWIKGDTLNKKKEVFEIKKIIVGEKN